MAKFRFTSLYGNWQLDLDLHLTGSWVPGYIYLIELLQIYFSFIKSTHYAQSFDMLLDYDCINFKIQKSQIKIE